MNSVQYNGRQDPRGYECLPSAALHGCISLFLLVTGSNMMIVIGILCRKYN